MFKNKAVYVEVVPKKEGPTSYITQTQETNSAEKINEIITEQAENVVKSVVTIVGAFFVFKTVSYIAINRLSRRY